MKSHPPRVRSATIDIDGSVSLVNIVSPKPLIMTAKGDINNSTVSAQNFRTTDKTVITAGGRFFEPNKYSFVTIKDIETQTGTKILRPDFALLGEAVLVNPDGSLKLDTTGKPMPDTTVQGMVNQFTYSGGVLGFAGRMTSAQWNALDNMFWTR